MHILGITFHFSCYKPAIACFEKKQVQYRKNDASKMNFLKGKSYREFERIISRQFQGYSIQGHNHRISRETPKVAMIQNLKVE